MILNKSGESGHLFLVLISEESLLFFIIKQDVYFFLDALDQVKDVPSVLGLLRVFFIMNGY